ncbi:MAG TPA: hypothetical protein VIL28_10760, partial [Steroidobacteraceae bacterium]
VWLALGCVVLGLFPTFVLARLSSVGEQLGFSGLDLSAAPWWLLVPLSDRETSYAPLIFLGAVTLLVVLTIYGVRRFYHQRVRHGPAWGCGFGEFSSRMQDTAEGFGQPIRHLFQPFFDMKRELPTPFDAEPRYRVVIGDRLWQLIYAPLGKLVQLAANSVAWLQQGRISSYLLYSFVTLIVLLALML